MNSYDRHAFFPLTLKNNGPIQEMCFLFFLSRTFSTFQFPQYGVYSFLGEGNKHKSFIIPHDFGHCFPQTVLLFGVFCLFVFIKKKKKAVQSQYDIFVFRRILHAPVPTRI